MTVEQLKGLVADLARPVAIVSSALSASAAGIIIAFRVQNFTLEGAAIFVGALHAGLAALYGAKAWEIERSNRHAADVEKARVAAPGVSP